MVFEEVQELIVDMLDVDASEITMDTNIKDDLKADSLDLYELVVILEEEFNVEIPSDRLSSEIDTIEDLVRILKELGVED